MTYCPDCDISRERLIDSRSLNRRYTKRVRFLEAMLVRRGIPVPDYAPGVPKVTPDPPREAEPCTWPVPPRVKAGRSTWG